MRKGLTAFIAIAAAALVATPLAIGTTRALATSDASDEVAARVAVRPVEAMPVAPPQVADCTPRKVRVVYSGYGTPPTACSPTVSR